MVGAVATLGLGGGSCESARVVLFGVGATPQRATPVEQALIGRAPSEALFAEAAEKAAEGLEDTISDVHASAEYRRHLAQVLTRRALAEAAERA
jgi:carbon-monoxide dehydrogenase medium subunit